MKDELVKQLEETYPKIFSGNYGGMCISDGWFNIINTLCHIIQHHIDQINNQREYVIVHNRIVHSCREGYFRDFDEKYKNHSNPEWVQSLRGNYANGSEQLHEIPKGIKQSIAAQVKEKFGGLRFYVTNSDDYIHGAITMAENIAYQTCQECGNVGSTEGSKGWIGVLCPTHRAEYNDQLNRGEY